MTSPWLVWSFMVPGTRTLSCYSTVCGLKQAGSLHVPGCGGRERFLNIVTSHWPEFCYMVTLSCMGGWGARSSSRLPSASWKSGLCCHRRKSRFWGQPTGCRMFKDFWGDGGCLSCLFSFCTIVAFLMCSICRARGSFPLYHYGRCAVAIRTVLFSYIVLNS